MPLRCTFSAGSKQTTVAVGGAGGDDRDLALEGDEAFEDERHAAKCCISAIRAVGRRAEDFLALAVIAEAAGLQHALAAELASAASRSAWLSIGMEAARGDAAAVDEALFGEAVLGGFQRLGGG